MSENKQGVKPGFLPCGRHLLVRKRKWNKKGMRYGRKSKEMEKSRQKNNMVFDFGSCSGFIDGISAGLFCCQAWIWL